MDVQSHLAISMLVFTQKTSVNFKVCMKNQNELELKSQAILRQHRVEAEIGSVMGKSVQVDPSLNHLLASTGE